MNVKVNSFNSFAFVSMAALAISGGSLVACQLQPAMQEQEHVSFFTPKTQPSTYGVLTAKITGKHSGVAVIKLDSFRLNVSFDFDAHPDSYGVPGSEFTAVEITQLTVNEITDVNGKSYNDFTEFEDIRNINALLKGFIERSKLVEADHV
ncbi:hypothetical protein Q5M49_13285 [Acinetobacter nosocomialis]|uniref:hypothetical protein n=1 Tax=Acinetobacter nosocomialis TaxID=106654 RepID=UPI0026F5FC8E|nr:hypothetical protein [Acinetobacter nosocomialis]MDO7194649.1 hypothetical protein [Acinetobacter nosocomialis]